MIKAVIRLIKVKSIVTIMLCAVFCGLSANGIVSGEQFLTVFTTVIAFYFGTQTGERGEDKGGRD